jgi:RNA polymerase sigma-70 factor (ECF subfamily)
MTPSTGLAGLDEALERHADFVRGLARRLVTDPGRADDLEQQTWMAMLRAQPTRGHGLRGWLATVTRRFAARMHREDSRRRSRETVAARPEQTESACDILQHEAAIRRVVDTVFGLDEPYRSTLVMRFYEDLTPQQIAERTGVPDATVRTRLKRGLDQVRRRLDRSGLEWRRALLPVAFGPLLPKAATAAGSMAAAATSVVPPGLGVLLMTKKTLTFTLVALCICVSAVVVFNLPDDAGGVPTTDFDSQTVVDPVANGERQDESTGKATPVDIDPFKERDGGEGRDSGRISRTRRGRRGRGEPDPRRLRGRAASRRSRPRRRLCLAGGAAGHPGVSREAAPLRRSASVTGIRRPPITAASAAPTE